VSKGGGRPNGGRGNENAKHTQGLRDRSVSMSSQRIAGASRYDIARQRAELEKSMERGNIPGTQRRGKRRENS
jgi:hypothetical protein